MGTKKKENFIKEINDVDEWNTLCQLQVEYFGVISPRHFPKGNFQSDNYTSDNFPNVKFPISNMQNSQSGTWKD